MKVADIMTTKVVAIRGSSTVAQAAALMKQEGVHALVVIGLQVRFSVRW